jgi:hypothetical protein
LQAVSAVPAGVPKMTMPHVSRSGTLKATWAWIGTNHDAITIVFTIIAALYVLIEYIGNEHNDKIKRTLELQARYSQGELLASRIKLNAFMLDTTNKDKIDKERGNAKSTKITELVREAKLEGNILTLTDFFKQAATCIEKDICDRDTACAAFHSDLTGQRNTYYDLYQSWKVEWGEDLIDDSFQIFNKRCKS